MFSIRKITLSVLTAFVLVTFAGCASYTVDPSAKDVYLHSKISPLESAVDALIEGDALRANEMANRELRNNPRDPRFNLINALAYQARAKGEGYLWNMAKVGYVLSHKFDPYLWQASYLSGLLELHERDLDTAAVSFAKAVAASPDVPGPFYGLAAASYARGDFSLAYRAAGIALDIDDSVSTEGLQIAALCFAAAADFTRAERQLVKMQQLGGGREWFEDGPVSGSFLATIP